MPDEEASRRERLKDVFAVARRLEGRERDEYLALACEGDTDLRADVESLLAAQASMGSFLDDDSPGEAMRAPLEEALGAMAQDDVPRRIGPYSIRGLLGRGGMGTVYEAEQDNPRRRVALKVLPAGLVSPELVARFEREAAILGSLQHRGIAQVFEAGFDRGLAGGTRYFAMELVDGQPLTDHAAHHGLGVRERLELLAVTCDAVAHAHARGIVHRDLKPANVLVTRDGQPKVLDFGIARPLDVADVATALQTRLGQVVGTVPYMSPEQADARIGAVCERSDVFSLGVLAFELLTGRLPRQIGELPLAEMIHAVSEMEPDRLSAADARLRGDVDAIVAKALAMEPARRYASAAEMADDLRRYLRSEPIVARPPSRAYRVRRYVQRHRLLVASSSAVLIAVSVGLALALASLSRETRQRRRADANAQRAELGRHRALLSAAVASLREEDGVAARKALAGVEPAARGWEWSLLEGMADQTFARFAGAGEGHELHASADASTLVAFTNREVLRVDAETGLAAGATFQAAPGELFERFSPKLGHVMSLWRDRWWLVDVGTGQRRDLADAGERRQLFDVGKEDVGFTGSGVAWIGHGESSPGIDFLDPESGRIVAALPDASRLPLPYESWEAMVVRHGASGSMAAIPDPRAPPVAIPSSGAVLRLTSFDARQGVLYLAYDGTLEAWRLREPASLAWRREGLPLHCWALVNSPDGAHVVSCHDRLAFVLDAADGATLAEIPVTRSAARPAFSPDGRRLAIQGRRREMRVHDSRALDDVVVLQGADLPFVTVTFLSNGDGLAGLDVRGRGCLWSLREDARRTLRGHASFVYALALNPSGRRAMSAAWDGTVRWWDLDTGRCLLVRHAPSTDGWRACLALDRTGRRLLTSHDGIVTAWDARTGGLVASVPLTVADVADTWRHSFDQVAWLDDGHRALLCSPWRRALELAVDDAGGLDTSEWPVLFGAVAVTPDGSLVAGAHDRDVELWDASRRERLRTLTGHDDDVLALAFSADGRRLASTGEDGSVRTWDVATGAPVLQAAGHSGPAYCVAFSPDGRRLVSGGGDDVVRAWDAETGEELVVLPGHGDYVKALAFTPDGETLVTGSGDATLRTWSGRLESSRRRAAAREAEALRTDVAPLVARLFGEGLPAEDVLRRIDEDPALDAARRAAAGDLVLERAAAAGP